MDRLTAIRRHDNLSYRAGIIGFQDKRRGIRYSVGQNIVNIELILFENEFLEQCLHGRALVRVGVQDRIAAKCKRELFTLKNTMYTIATGVGDLRKYIQPLSRGECN